MYLLCAVVVLLCSLQVPFMMRSPPRRDLFVLEEFLHLIDVQLSEQHLWCCRSFLNEARRNDIDHYKVENQHRDALGHIVCAFRTLFLYKLTYISECNYANLQRPANPTEIMCITKHWLCFQNMSLLPVFFYSYKRLNQEWHSTDYIFKSLELAVQQQLADCFDAFRENLFFVINVWIPTQNQTLLTRWER